MVTKPLPKGFQMELAEEPQTTVRTPDILRCKCEGCQAMRAEYPKDHSLLQFYARNLLVRGWPGKTSDAEKLYRANHAQWYRAAQERGRKLAELLGAERQES